MIKRPKIWAFGVTVIFTGFIVSVAWAGEPNHRGRSLTSWLNQYYDASLQDTQKMAKAHEAICAIGATNALPYLLDLIKATDGPLRSWVIQKNEKWDIRLLKLREAAVTQQLGITGFEVLETNCAPAVPELTRMLDDTNRAMVALRCLVFIGGPAERSICRALTNHNQEVRGFAASQVAWVTDDMDLYLARLNGPLNDPDGRVRFAAVQSLGLQKTYPDEVIPLLVKAMYDPQQSVSGYAAKFLGELGTNALKACDALSNVAENGNAYMATHALSALVCIDPNRALPMALAWLRASDSERRARGASVLGKFSTATPEILQALKNAATDSDAKVVQSAIGALRTYQESEKQRVGSDVVIDGEPSYGGRRLGEWLKNKADTGEFSEEVKHAIREMGANAIPALLARLVYSDEKFGLPNYDARVGAVGGFYILGEVAVAALPKLEGIMNGADENLAVLALIAASNMGTNSVSVVIRAFTNRHADVRSQAVSLFIDGPMQSFSEGRKQAVPQIRKLLGDSDESVRLSAANALKEIDPKAAAKAGVK